MALHRRVDVAVGALPYEQLNGDKSPLATVLSQGADLSWGADLISFGALIAITSVVLTILFGQTRIMFSMSRDGLVSRGLANLSSRGTPVVLTILFAFPSPCWPRSPHWRRSQS